MSTITIDDAIAAYLKLRDKKEQLEKEVEEKVEAIKAKMAKLEAWIKEQADQQGVTSFKTKHGTAFLVTTDFASVADWDSLLKFVLENEHYEMLTKSVSKVAVRDYLQAHNAIPPGVNYGTKISVNIRRPSSKVED